MIRGGAWFIYAVMQTVFLPKFSAFTAILPIFAIHGDPVWATQQNHYHHIFWLDQAVSHAKFSVKNDYDD